MSGETATAGKEPVARLAVGLYVAAAMILLGSVAVAGVIVATDDDAVQVVLQPVGSEPVDPFTDSAVSIPDDVAVLAAERRDAPEVQGRVELTAVSGASGGLYATSAAHAACDVEGLAEMLTDSSARADAWAEVVGISADEIAGFVGSLAPVVLARDTAVTNHSYRGGRAAPFAALLQAGTAVVVDDRGAPRVQCASGNPLTPAGSEWGRIEVSDPPWAGFDASDVALVEAEPDPLDEIEVVDIETRDPVVVPLEPTPGNDPSGPSGPSDPDGPAAPETVELDGLLVSDDEGVHVVSEDGSERTTVVDHPVAVAYDDGAGGIVYNELDGDREPGSFFEPPSSTEAATIWHLPAGATEPVALVGSDDPATSWAYLRGAGVLGGRPVVAYAAMAHNPTLGTDGQAGDLVIRDVETGEESVAGDGVYGWEATTSDVTFGDELLAFVPFSESPVSPGWQVLDADLAQGSTACTTGPDDEVEPCPVGNGALVSPSTVVMVEYSETGDSVHLLEVDVENATTSEPDVSIGGYVGDWNGDISIDGDGTRVVVSFVPNDGGEAFPAVIYDPADGSSAEVDVAGTARLLRAPVVRPAEAPAPEPEPAPATTEAEEAPDIDLSELTLEQVAVGFVEAATTGGDPSQYVIDTPEVAVQASDELPDIAYEGSYEFRIHPTYVSPDSQGGVGGECQLVGDITVLCAVEVLRPDLGEPDSSSLIAVYTSSAGPGGTPEEPTPGDPHVTGFEVIAG